MVIGSKLILNNFVNLLVLISLLLFLFFIVQDIQDKAVLTKEETSVFMQKAQQAKLEVSQVQQWLSDISATRATGGFDDGFAEAEKSANNFRNLLGDFQRMFAQENDQVHLNEINKVLSDFESYFSVGKKMAQSYIDEGPVGGNAMMPQFDEAAEKLMTQVNGLAMDQKKELEDSMGMILQSIDELLAAILMALLLGTIVAVGFGAYLYHSIVGLLKTLVLNLSGSAEEVASASEEISKSSIQLSQGAISQATSLEQTSSAMEELSSQTKENAHSATGAASSMQEVLNMVQHSVEISTSAAKLSNQAKETSEQGVSSMHEISEAMERIGEDSKKISDIIEVINEITQQTKMLSTNAAIEAARAGEQGKGFSVVANEVSKLAEDSKSAAKQIETLIKASVGSAQAGVAKSHAGEEVLKTIYQHSSDVADLMDNTLEAANMQAERISEISSQINNIQLSSNEQASGVAEVSSAVVQIEQVTQSNASNSEETASSSEELSAQAKMMHDLVSQIAGYVGLSGLNKARAKAPKAARHQENQAPISLPSPKTLELPAKGNGGAGQHMKPNKAIPMRDDFKEF